MGLPRELLKWILSLQLSMPIRQPRRDFANGMLVAEILTKHDVGDLSLHSFTNSNSTEEKRNNWSLIQKCLRTQGVNLTDETIAAILIQDQTAVERFLQNLFSFVTSQADRSEASSPPTPQLSAGARMLSVESDDSTSLSEQARLEAVSSQYTMDNLQHLMQQQLALFAPERQQGIIASVIEQRSIFVQKLMDGETPQDAMCAALANAQCRLPDLETAQPSTQLEQRLFEQDLSDRRQPPQIVAPIAAAKQHRCMLQQQPACGSGRVAHNRPPHALGSVPKQSTAAPFSVLGAVSQSPMNRQGSIRNSGAETSSRHTMQAWRNDVNNPKTDSYRYWDLGSLGPQTNEELMAKKMAAQKAREYGIRVGELVKANTQPREPPKKEMSKQERAKQFAKTVPIPTKRADTKSATQTAAESVEAAEQSIPTMPAARTVHRRDSVDSMMTRHDTNAKSIADIKAEIRTWEAQDQQGSDVPRVLPHLRRKSPTRRVHKQPSAPHPKQDVQPIRGQPQDQQGSTPVVEAQPVASVGDISGEVHMQAHESAVETA